MNYNKTVKTVPLWLLMMMLIYFALREVLTFHFHALEKEMATHSSVLAWRISGTGEPDGCHLWGHTELDTTEVT